MLTKALPKLHFDDVMRIKNNILQGQPDACWPWVLSHNGHGYGQINIQGNIYKVTRLAYMLHYGADPGEFGVLHDCDNPPCCNPSHLFLGTQQDNMADLKAKGGLLRLDLDVDRIFVMAKSMSQRAIARELNCSQYAITKILLGRDYHRPI